MVIHRGTPFPRPPGSPPNCLMPVGCKKGKIDDQNVLTETNAKINKHYRECKGVMKFPDDPHVRANASIISQVDEMLDRSEQTQVAEVVKAVARRGL